MLIRPKNSKFYYGIFYVNRKNKWINLKTEKESEAKTLYGMLKARLKQNELRSKVSELLGEKESKPRPLMIQEVEKRYKEVNQNYSPSGILIFNGFRRWLNDDWSDIADVDTATALRYLKGFKNGKTHNNIKSAMSKIWTTLLSFSNIEENIWQRIPNHEKQTIKFRPLTQSEIERLLKVATNAEWKDAVMIAVHTGLRKKDIFNLQISNIKRDGLEIMPAKTSKHNKSVFIPVHPAIKAIIKQRKAHASSEGYIFPSLHKSYDSGAEHRRIEGYFKDAKIADNGKGQAGFHSLRGSFITALDSAHIDRRITRGIVGHVEDRQTDWYSDDRESAKVIKSLKFRKSLETH